MKVNDLTCLIRLLGVETVTGIPDSTLSEFCAWLDGEGEKEFLYHIVPSNEGAAVGIAIGEYLSSEKPACVYMQNSGLGNIVNPITSLANDKVYGIPMLFVIGWRGEPGNHDEPQHKYMGEVTEQLISLLDIEYSVINMQTNSVDLEMIYNKARHSFEENKQYAIIVKRNTFEKEGTIQYKNKYSYIREDVIKLIVSHIKSTGIIVSTTGKISRELYENMDMMLGSHEQAFLCVGGMGHPKYATKEIKQCEFGMFEYIAQYYEKSSFDAVIIYNALDHCIDPLKAIFEILFIVKEGGVIYMRHYRAEGMGGYTGLHQWNLDYNANGDFLIWNYKSSVNVTEIINEIADVHVEYSESQKRDEQNIITSIKKKKDFDLWDYISSKDEMQGLSNINQKLLEFIAIPEMNSLFFDWMKEYN